MKTDEDLLTVDIAHVSLRSSDPDFGINALSGIIRRSKKDLAFEKDLA